MAFNKFVAIDNGVKELLIISEEVGKFRQHYIKKRGWLTCLQDWYDCPFCLSCDGIKYNPKIKFYIDVIELDSESATTSTILVLTGARYYKLKNWLTSQDKSFVGTPFLLEKKGSDIELKLSDNTTWTYRFDIKNIIKHDWNVVCKPLNKLKAEAMVQSDCEQYTRD